MNRSAFALAAMIVLGAAQAHADSIVVSTHGLNLAKPADMRVLNSRIETAAMDVCGAPRGSSTLVVWEVEHSSCYHEAVTIALASIPSTTKLASR